MRRRNPSAVGGAIRHRAASSDAACFVSHPSNRNDNGEIPTPCWRPQSGKSRGCGGRAPAITPAGAAVIACLLTQNVQRSGPQPFQAEPRGESPPARCPKPTRRNAGLAIGPPKQMLRQLRWLL
jgi:hypothetical protein